MAKKGLSVMTIVCIGVLCVGIVFFNMQTKSSIIEGVGRKNLRWSESCTLGLKNEGKAKGDQRCIGQTRTYYGAGFGNYFDFATNDQELYYGVDTNDT